MAYDLTQLGERSFEDLMRALAVRTLGPSVRAFGDGPDGGREAVFDGRVNYVTSSSGPWVGYGVMQAKYRRSGAGNNDAQWLRRQITKELGAWLDTSGRRATEGRAPEYLIIATNVPPSSVARTGGIDRTECLLTGYAGRLGLKGWAVWDANQITMYLNAYPDVSARFAQFITPGDVLAKTFPGAGRPARAHSETSAANRSGRTSGRARFQRRVPAGRRSRRAWRSRERGLRRRPGLGPAFHGRAGQGGRGLVCPGRAPGGGRRRANMGCHLLGGPPAVEV